jgi:hypothetical protein
MFLIYLIFVKPDAVLVGYYPCLMKKREGKLTDEEVSKDTNIAASWPSRFMKNQELVFYGRNIMIQFLYLLMIQSFSFDQ